MFERQKSTALYFIDVLALRAGHEKDDDEADTVGCCTLKARLSLHWYPHGWAGALIVPCTRALVFSHPVGQEAGRMHARAHGDLEIF